MWRYFWETQQQGSLLKQDFDFYIVTWRFSSLEEYLGP